MQNWSGWFLVGFSSFMWPSRRIYLLVLGFCIRGGLARHSDSVDGFEGPICFLLLAGSYVLMGFIDAGFLLFFALFVPVRRLHRWFQFGFYTRLIIGTWSLNIALAPGIYVGHTSSYDCLGPRKVEGVFFSSWFSSSGIDIFSLLQFKFSYEDGLQRWVPCSSVFCGICMVLKYLLDARFSFDPGGKLVALNSTFDKSRSAYYVCYSEFIISSLGSILEGCRGPTLLLQLFVRSYRTVSILLKLFQFVSPSDVIRGSFF